jgi:hypothetical protein
MISAHTPGTRRLRANTAAHGASAGLDAPDAYPFKRARITRRTFGSAAEVPIVLDSSDNDSDSNNNSASDDDLERAIVKIAKTNSLSDVSHNANQKMSVKSKSRAKTTTKLSSKDTSHTKPKSKATSKSKSKSKSAPTAADATLALKITNVPRKTAPTTTSRLTINLAKVAAMEAPTPMPTPTIRDTRKSQNGATTTSSEDHLVPSQASDSNSAENKIASNGFSSPGLKKITLVSPSPPPPPPPSSDSLATVKSAAPNKVDEKLAVSIASTVSRMLDVAEPKVPAKKCIPTHVMESIPKHTADSAPKSNTTSVNSLSPASILSLTSSSAGSTPSPIVNSNDLTHNFPPNSLKPSSQPIQFGDKSMNQRQIEIDKIKERIQEKIKLSQAKARERLKLKEFAKKKAREEEKNFIPVFDPSIHKSYKDIYSKSCISCAKKGRGEYCNRQQPCDICVGKRLKNCTFPADAEVAIPAKHSNRSGSVARTSKDFAHIASSLKHANRDTRVDDTNGSGHDHDKVTAKAKSTVNANGNANGNDIGSGSGSGSVNGNGNGNGNDVRSTLVTSTVNSKNTALEDSSTYDSGSDDDSVVKTIGSARSGRNSRKLAKAVSYDEDDDDDADVDNSDSESEGDSDVISSESEGDEDYEFQVEDELKLPRKEKRAEKTRNRKSRSPSDNFERAQKILRTLEFEKRDVDVYTAGRRRRAAAATRADYYIPSDNENPEDSGYAEAEARNEQVILSEDEEQRRLLRGELDAEYLETLRKEREKKSKPVLDESDSEEDEMFFN